jgi:hypothetical protein
VQIKLKITVTFLGSVFNSFQSELAFSMVTQERLRLEKMKKEENHVLSVGNYIHKRNAITFLKALQNI